VTDLSLSIEQRFFESPFCEFVEDDVYAWYSKCGGEHSALSAVVHLKDANGLTPKIVDELQLLTELVYEDGSPTPLQPICPLKDRKSGKTSDKPLYRRLCPDPKIKPDKCSATVRFRIEEVTFHHSGHHGFKLKVYPVRSQSLIVHPAVMDEIIVVLSKPKMCRRKSSLLGTVNTQNKKRKVSVKEEYNPTVEVPINLLLNGYRMNGKCLCCKQGIPKDDFLKKEAHCESCLFYTLIVQNLLGTKGKENKETRYETRQHSILDMPNTSLPVSLTSNDTSTQVASSSNSLSISGTTEQQLMSNVGIPINQFREYKGCDLNQNPEDINLENHDNCDLHNLKYTNMEGNEECSARSLSGQVRMKESKTHFWTSHIDFTNTEQNDLDSDPSHLFSSKTLIKEENLKISENFFIDEADCSMPTLEDSISMEENERYLLQEFPLPINFVKTSSTDNLVKDGFVGKCPRNHFKVEEMDESSLVTMIETLSPRSNNFHVESDLITYSSSIDSSKINEENLCPSSMSKSTTPIRLSEAPSSPSFSYSEFMKGIADVDNMSKNFTTVSSSLYLKDETKLIESPTKTGDRNDGLAPDLVNNNDAFERNTAIEFSNDSNMIENLCEEVREVEFLTFPI